MLRAPLQSVPSSPCCLLIVVLILPLESRLRKTMLQDLPQVTRLANCDVGSHLLPCNLRVRRSPQAGQYFTNFASILAVVFSCLTSPPWRAFSFNGIIRILSSE